MKRFALSIVLLTGLLFTLTQCAATEAGKKTADKFFDAILNQDFATAESMMELPIGSPTLPQDLQSLQNNPTDGQLLSFRKSMGSNTQINNGVTTVELPYVLTYDNGERTYTVIVKNRGGGNKIVSIQ